MRPARRFDIGFLLCVLALVGVLPGVAAADQASDDGAAPRDLDDALPTETRQWLDEVGSVRVGWSAALAPVSVVQDGEVVGGYAVDAWDLAALRLGFEIQHVAFPDAAALGGALQAGEIDVVGALGFHPSVADEQPSRPFAWVPVVLVGTREQAALGASDLSGRTISSLPGAQVREAVDEAHPGAIYVATDGPVEGLRAVADGDIDLYFGPLALLGYQISQLDLDLVPVGEPGASSTVQSWTRPDGVAATLVVSVRDSLTDADLALLHRRWTGFDLSDPDTSQPPTWLLPTLLLAGLVLLAAVGFVVVLRARVRAATDELRQVNEELESVVEDRTAELAESALRLRRSNKALKRFTSTAAHDLKGPLAAIRGLADVAIQMQLPTGQRDDVLRRVRDSARRLGRMIDDMLEDAVSMGAQVAALRGGAFEDWLRDVTGPELDVIDGRLEVDIPDRVLDLDVEALRRSSINLVGNAVKYAVNEEGVVVHVVLSRRGDTWELEVEDNGPGIPPGLWSEVFDRGSRLTHDDRGFGLGLAAIRDLVQGAGGSIRVGDADLGGASFVVTLPVVPSAAESSVSEDEAAAVSPEHG